MAEHEDDHTLLIRVDQKLDGLSQSLTELKVAMAKKADSAEMSRLEKRHDNLEGKVEADRTKLYMIIGGIGVLELMASFVIALLTGHLGK